MNNRLSIYDIKYLCQNEKNYFTTQSLKSVGLTLKSFRVYKINPQWYKIIVLNGIHHKIKYFDAINNILVGEYTYDRAQHAANTDSTDSTAHNESESTK
jgi:hypothetical protein